MQYVLHVLVMKTQLHFRDWLPFLEYGLDLALRPYPARFLPGGNSWYDLELKADLARLKRARLIEAVGQEGADRAWQMVRQGPYRQAPADPESRWKRGWDSEWRIVVFDLQRCDQGYRSSLWRWLRSNRFGMLQYSVWISPDPINTTAQGLLRSSERMKRALQVFEGQASVGTGQASVVAKAWDFAAINLLYERVLQHHKKGLEMMEAGTASPRTKRVWIADECRTWEAALFADPLLPTELHPLDYLGPQAWGSRKELYRQLASR
jgi:DNA-binding transcriptional regulator PaaX